MRGLIVVVLSVGFASTTAAQSSGGAFGGSRGFGGGGSSSSSSSSSSWSSSSSSSSNSYDTTSTEPEETAEERAAREAAAAAWEAEQRRQERLRQDRRVPPRERARLERYFGSDRLERPHEVVTHASERELAEHEVGERDYDSAWNATIVGGADDEGDSPHWPLALGVWFGLWAGMWLVGRWREGGRIELSGGPGHRPTHCEVRRVSLAFDWTERARLQRALDALARRDTSTAQGMYAAARQTITLLGRSIDAARYATISRQIVGAQRAEKRFFTLCQELESRYRYDRTKGGREKRFEAKSEEGEGLVVVSFVVGSTRPIGDVPRRYTTESVLAALEGCARLSPHELVALKVIWSPAAEDDRMSSLELETIYPELTALGDTRIGQHRCGHCGALRAAEIRGCPACGSDD